MDPVPTASQEQTTSDAAVHSVYEMRGIEADDPGLFRGRSYLTTGGTMSISILRWGPYHTHGGRSIWFLRRDMKGSAYAEISRHDDCRSRRHGLLEHDLRMVFASLLRDSDTIATRVIDGHRIAVHEHAGTTSLWAGWLTEGGFTVLIDFDRHHAVKPDLESDPLLRFLLSKHPSVLPETFGRVDWPLLWRTEAEKVMESGLSKLAAAGLTFYPYFGSPLFSAKDFDLKDVRERWAMRRDRCLHELRLELVDAALVEMRKWEGRKLPRTLVDRYQDALPWVALRRDVEDEWTGRHDFWASWWSAHRSEPLHMQWRSLFDKFLATFPESRIPASMEENWKAFTLTNERLVRLRDMAGLGTAGPPGFEQDPIGGRVPQKDILKAWQTWWRSEKDRYIPPLVSQSEREWGRYCSCGTHRPRR